MKNIKTKKTVNAHRTLIMGSPGKQDQHDIYHVLNNVCPFFSATATIVRIQVPRDEGSRQTVDDIVRDVAKDKKIPCSVFLRPKGYGNPVWMVDSKIRDFFIRLLSHSDNVVIFWDGKDYLTAYMILLADEFKREGKITNGAVYSLETSAEIMNPSDEVLNTLPEEVLNSLPLSPEPAQTQTQTPKTDPQDPDPTQIPAIDKAVNTKQSKKEWVQSAIQGSTNQIPVMLNEPMTIKSEPVSTRLPMWAVTGLWTRGVYPLKLPVPYLYNKCFLIPGPLPTEGAGVFNPPYRVNMVYVETQLEMDAVRAAVIKDIWGTPAPVIPLRYLLLLAIDHAIGDEVNSHVLAALYHELSLELSPVELGTYLETYKLASKFADMGSIETLTFGV